MSNKRILPADVYDALELSALAYGGIGAGRWVEDGGAGFGSAPADIPVCASGHAFAADPTNEMWHVLQSADLGIRHNDPAVVRINVRRGNDYSLARVSFAEWCAELGVERGS